MTKSAPTKNNDEQKATCSNTGHEKRFCRCFDCSPSGFSFTGYFTDCRNIEELTERAEKLWNYLEYLRSGGFAAEVRGDGDWFRIHDPLVGGCYWAECRGCGYPLLLDIGEDPDDFSCKSCNEILAAKADQPKHYGDLFNYIDTMFKFANKGGRTLTESHGFTKEFCDVHGFDFDAIKRRLEVTGGYDDGEVMMNSYDNIPLLDELPIKLEEPDEEEDEE